MSVAVPVGVGIAVLRTERTETLVGSIVAGSMARAMRFATAWALGVAVAVEVAATVRERMVVGFMVVG